MFSPDFNTQVRDLGLNIIEEYILSSDDSGLELDKTQLTRLYCTSADNYGKYFQRK